MTKQLAFLVMLGVCTVPYVHADGFGFGFNTDGGGTDFFDTGPSGEVFEAEGSDKDNFGYAGANLDAPGTDSLETSNYFNEDDNKEIGSGLGSYGGTTSEGSESSSAPLQDATAPIHTQNFYDTLNQEFYGDGNEEFSHHGGMSPYDRKNKDKGKQHDESQK